MFSVTVAPFQGTFYPPARSSPYLPIVSVNFRSECVPLSLTVYTAEQWTKEGKYALNCTRLSCHRFVANQVRLQLFILAYNLGNFLRRLCLPKAVKHWSLRSVQIKLIKIGARLVFQFAEVAVPREVFWQVLQRIGRVRPVPE